MPTSSLPTIHQVRPAGRRILVRRLPEEVTTEAGLFLPADREKDGAYMAEVLGFGELVQQTEDGQKVIKQEDGTLHPLTVAVGDTVLVSRALGYHFEGPLEEKYAKGLSLIFDMDILAVIDKERTYFTLTAEQVYEVLRRCAMAKDVSLAGVVDQLTLMANDQ